jgi:hypothetical protein
MISIDGRNLEVCYYLSVSELWPDKKGDLWLEWSYKRGTCSPLTTIHLWLWQTLFYLRAIENLDVRKQEIKSIQNSEGTTLLWLFFISVTVKTSMMNKTVTVKTSMMNKTVTVKTSMMNKTVTVQTSMMNKTVTVKTSMMNKTVTSKWVEDIPLAYRSGVRGYGA